MEGEETVRHTLPAEVSSRAALGHFLAQSTCFFPWNQAALMGRLPAD